MAYGLQIFRDDGSLWISPDVTPLNYMGKISFANGTVDTGISSSKSLMFFVRHNGPDGAGTFIPNNSGSTWEITITGSNYSGLIYLFSNTVKSQSGYGVAVYNSSGEMTWNTDMLPLQVLKVNNPYGVTQTGSFTVSAGVPVAVNPGICSTWLAVLNPSAGQYIIGAIAAGAYGNTIYGTRIGGEEIVGQRPVYRYKEVFLCIDVSKYP